MTLNSSCVAVLRIADYDKADLHCCHTHKHVAHLGSHPLSTKGIDR